MEENYVMAEEYFTEESQMSSEVEFENAEDYFSDENCGFKFKVKSQLLKPVKRDLELKGNTTTLKNTPKCCEKNCVEKLEYVSLDAKNLIREKFKCKMLTQKNLLLDHLVNTSDVELSNYDEKCNYYYFEQNKICPKAYKDLTGVSIYILDVVRTDFNRGRRVKYEHGNQGKGRMTVAGSNCVAFLLEFSKKYAQDSPDEKLVILPKIFIVSELFHIYRNEVKGTLVAKNSFFKIFKQHFGPNRKNKDMPRIRISSYSSHAKCDTCVKLQEARKMVRCVADLDMVRKKTEEHRLEYGGARIEVDRLLLQCQTFPKDYLGRSLILTFIFKKNIFIYFIYI